MAALFTPVMNKPDPAELARQLLRRADRAALGVALAEGDQRHPYVSLVLLAIDHDLAPILLISALAEHSKAIAGDDRVSLLIDGTGGLEQPLTGPRLSLVGRAIRCDAPRLRARYLARHPDATGYAGFKDFAFYRIKVERGHLVGGFGMIHWLDQGALSMPEALTETLVEDEAGIVAHMNEDHADAIDLYANRLLGLAGQGWRLSGIDRDGVDLRRSGQVARLNFEAPIVDASTARRSLVSLVKKARQSP